MRKYSTQLIALVAFFYLIGSAMGQEDQLSITFGKDMNTDDQRRVFLLQESEPKEREIQPEADMITYRIPMNARIRVQVTPRVNHVVFVWKTIEKQNEKEIAKSYGSTDQIIEGIRQPIEIFADICELVPVIFRVESEGSDGKEVNVEEQGDFGRIIKPQADGETYLLPKNRGAYFDPKTKDGYMLLSWTFGEGMRFPSRPDQFYKQSIPEGFFISARFYKEGETRTVTFSQPETAVLTVKNHSESETPEINSESKVTPGDEILFQVAPIDNPVGKVEVHHWEVNGEIHRDAKGGLITDNSISLFADEDLTVKVVPQAELGNCIITAAQPYKNLDYTYNAHTGELHVKTCQTATVELIDMAGRRLASIAPSHGVAGFDTNSLTRGTYILRQAEKSVKVWIW
ncbi:MAG: T9SS type A sorting domain-containing protein [Porphyromonas sp.]|nr:T9SS type A sorting domain-containing protein [Porphyromonas sp.]